MLLTCVPFFSIPVKRVKIYRLKQLRMTARIREKVVIFLFLFQSACIIFYLVYGPLIEITRPKNISNLDQFNRVHEDEEVSVVEINATTVAVASSPSKIENENSVSIEEGEKKNSSATIILMWTKFFVWYRASLWKLILKGLRSQPGCFCTNPENNVVITLNRSFLEQSAVIVFHPRDTNLSDLPGTRKPEQIWVAFEHETKDTNRNTNWTKYNGLFNWTMNFRRDSDVWSPYGTFLENERFIPENDIRMEGGLTLDQWISQKNESKLMAWVVSTCGAASGRDKLAQTLRELSLPIDTYGGCGEKKICPRLSTNCNHSMFWQQLAREYKFYLAAENSLCEDYITEKLWRTLEIGMVPVVYGGADYSQLAPPNSVINVRDFSTLKELVQFLKDLAKDKERYKSYFQWRSRFHIRADDCWAGFCSLCQKVDAFRNEKWTPERSKVYDDIKLHWNVIPAGNGLPRRPACFASLY